MIMKDNTPEAGIEAEVPAVPPERMLGRHPKGLALLFVTEMWERFSYYGMRGLLILFLVDAVKDGGLGWSQEDAGRLYGWYTSLVYLTPVLGGLLADRYLGTHRSLVLGGVIIALGHFTLALQTMSTFYIGLLLIIVGTGFFKPCASVMVGQLYGFNDPRRDAAYTIFYMGINLGAFIGPLICGWLAENPRYGWSYGFAAAGVGMVLGLWAYLAGRPYFLAGVGERPESQLKPAAGLPDQAVAPEGAEERQRILAIVIMAFFVIFFWSAFEQAGASLNLYALEKTNRAVSADTWLSPWLAPDPSTGGAVSLPASWFQSLNPLFILLFAPLFSWWWGRLQRLGLEPATPVKMALGLWLLGAGFVVMVYAALRSDGGALVSPWWLVLTYLLHTWGELCLSPVGLSFVNKLAPVRLAALLMGMWFLANWAANLIAGYLTAYMGAISKGELFHILSGQADFFLLFVATSFAAGLLLLLLTPRLAKLMHGIR
jgi:POT family proton-dependent oligopeptide transporter